MTITPTTLTRAAGLCAIAGGLLYLGVQINHPHLDAAFTTTTEYAVREGAKILFGGLALAGITGMYLRQTRQTGVLGLLGYVVFSVGFMVLMSVEIIGLCVLPGLARSNPGYVNDVLAVATGGHAAGDVGWVQALCQTMGLTYLGGGLIFGIALFRANILPRWAAVLLSFGSLATAAIPLLPQINQRLFALPTGAALVWLGYSLWREQRTAAAPQPAGTASHLSSAGVK